jgi:hypothetical protein
MTGEAARKFDHSVSLLSWAFNEEDSIVPFLERAVDLMKASVEVYEIVLVEDGSTDRTLELARAFAAAHPEVRVLPNGRNLNVGLSSRRAIAEARCEYLFWQTTDWAYDLRGLRGHLEHLRRFDIVQGARRLSFDRRSDTVGKALVSIGNYLVILLLFRVALTDFQNVTFYPTDWIQSLTLEARSSFANPEGLLKSFWRGRSIKEVPIGFLPRDVGSAKGTRPAAVAAAIADIVRLWSKWVLLGGRGRVQKGIIQRLDGTVFPGNRSLPGPP